MVGPSQKVSTLVIVAFLLLVAAICAGDQTRLTPHLEASDACCGFVQCSVLLITLVGFALWVTGANVRLEAAPSIRSTAQDPLSPPPELIALRTA